MARLARVVAPGYPHHVTQRGNRRQRTFFSDADYRLYLDLMGEWCGRCGVVVWAYCLMPNHVHLLLETGSVPLAKFMQGLQQSYTQYFNWRYRKVGHLFQGRVMGDVVD